MATTGYFFNTPKNSKVQIANGDASGLKTVVTGAAAGSKVVALIAASDDTSARDVTFGVTKSATFYPLASKTIPITAGTIAATPPVNLLDPSIIPGLPVDNDGQPYIFLETGDTLQAKSLTTVTSGKLISLTAIHGDG
jgi:hypothetical protein